MVNKRSEFIRLFVDGKNIWVVGQNSPNSSILAAYNPDIILVSMLRHQMV